MESQVWPGIVRAFVLNGDGQPLMPCHPARARQLVRQGKAKWVRYDTIQLTYIVENPGLQPVTLGVTPGSDLVGLGAVAETKDSGERTVFQSPATDRHPGEDGPAAGVQAFPAQPEDPVPEAAIR